MSPEPEPLNVIALISGGKDSFYSLLHCLRNSHRVVALGNLYPPPPSPSSSRGERKESDDEEKDDNKDEVEEKDLNSFMYQTVGHSIIPLYAQALGIPLFRQEIRGGAVVKGLSYDAASIGSGTEEAGNKEEDETESLIPLLRNILKEFPHANALSTGAILSTYQRTRIESVALRLGLVPLAYLWQYPILPPGGDIALLEDMEQVGLEARIVKVASGGLDEGFLWMDVVGGKGRVRVERAMRRFGMKGDGGVIGEGGEFETLVLDGPGRLFKGRILAEEGERRVVREGGGAAWLSVGEGSVVMKEVDGDGRVVGESENECRVPGLLDERFFTLLRSLEEEMTVDSKSSDEVQDPSHRPNLGKPNTEILTWTFCTDEPNQTPTISEEASSIITSIHQRLKEHSLNSTHITSTVVILRSMNDFATINKIYSTLFPHPNPPSRVTISAGSLLPPSQNLLIHLTLSLSPPTLKKALHVQSRSYWAPANIGPYSQAITYPLPSTNADKETTSIVKIAGQIPLVPASMLLPSPSSSTEGKEHGFNFQTVLSLQHLWRIGSEMGARWWIGAIAYVPSSSPPPPYPTEDKAKVISKAWKGIHQPPSFSEDDAEEEPRDLWEEKYRQGSSTIRQEGGKRDLPDWSLDVKGIPPGFTVEVEELPRGSAVEWHALGGVAGDVRSVLMQGSGGEGWRMNQAVVDGGNVYTILSVLYDDEVGVVQGRLGDAEGFLGVERSGIVALGSATFVDVGIDKLWKVGDGWKGRVPCRSIWNGEGERVAGVWVLDGVV